MAPSKKPKPVPGVAAFMRAGLAAAEVEFGTKGTYVGAEHAKRHVGIPIPCLALQKLIHSSVWPLQKITLSAGAPKSCKSAFKFELQRWFLAAGGAVVDIDAESKTSPEMMLSMIPPEYFRDPELMIRYQVINAKTIEEWQLGVSLQLRRLRLYLLEHEVKPDFPLFVSVDAITAVGSDSDTEQIIKTGAGQGFRWEIL